MARHPVWHLSRGALKFDGGAADSSVMLKKIAVERLAPGMYVHDLGVAWSDHPFTFNRFKLKSEDQVAEMMAAGLQAVYIDTAKGDDVHDAPTAADVRAEVDARMLDVAISTETPAHLPVSEEIVNARMLHQRAHAVVAELMQDGRLGRAVQIENVAALVDDITQSVVRNSGALLAMLRLKNKDDYTFMHCVSVGTLMVTFGRSLGLQGDALRQAGIGGFVHDVGKTLIPDAVLNKPGPLTAREYLLIKRHPADGHEILLRSSNVGPEALDIALHHHERLDGKGYPEKCPPERISRLARMAAIVDVYDAITSDRPYHAGLAPTEALRKMLEWCNGHFDEPLLRRFIRCVGIYPTGTLVRLNNGWLAVVLEQNTTDLLKPAVRAVYCSQTRTAMEPLDIDLAQSQNYRIVADESPEQWAIDPMHFLDGTHGATAGQQDIAA